MQFHTALKRPFTNILTLLLGAILLPWIIINFFVYGYIIACARTAYKGKNSLPRFKASMFVNGFLAWFISFIYSIPVLFLLSVAIAIQASAQSFFMLITAIIGLFTLYITPAALICFASKQSFSAAFNQMPGFAFSKIYLKGLAIAFFCIGIIYFFTFLLVYYLLPFIFSGTIYFILTFLIASAGLFAGLISFATVLARAYRKI